MYPNFKIISEEFKADLKARINESLALEKQRARRKKVRSISWSIAAVFCLFIGITFVFKEEQKVSSSAIEQFAKSTETDSSFTKSNQVQLVLSNQKALAISDSTTIAYDASGNKVNVDHKEIKQKNSSEPKFNTVLVPYGKRAHLSLADGTLVWLNSGSKLIYPTSFDTSKESFSGRRRYF